MIYEDMIFLDTRGSIEIWKKIIEQGGFRLVLCSCLATKHQVLLRRFGRTFGLFHYCTECGSENIFEIK